MFFSESYGFAYLFLINNWHLLLLLILGVGMVLYSINGLINLNNKNKDLLDK